MKPREGIIGLDGVPIHLLETLTDNNTMPYMKQLIKEGTLAPLQSSLPPNSATSWNSMITGKNPGKHGIFGFTEFIPGTYSQSFHNSHKLKAKPFWQKTNKHNLIINLPASYPVQPLNGAMITGFVSPNLNKSIYPQEHLTWLQENNYQVDVDASIFNESVPLFLEKLNETLEKRVNLIDYLLSKHNYHTLFFIVTGTDRIEHYLWNAYMDNNHPHHQDFLDFFKKVDQTIEHITELLDPSASLMMLSDHGMGPINTSVNLNTLLRQEDYLIHETNPRKNYNNIQKETRAFVAEQTKIYLNHIGKFPNGSVKKTKVNELQEELIELLLGLTYKGKKVVKNVYKKQNIFSGPQTSNGPDLVVIPHKGFTFKTNLFKENIFGKDLLTGTHTEDDAFLYIREQGLELESLWIKDAINIFKQIGEKNHA